MPAFFLPGRSSQGIFMTSSEFSESSGDDLVARALDLYRDLTVVLRNRITLLMSHEPHDQECKAAVDVVRSHYKALQTVLDLEANIEKRNFVDRSSGIGELDLETARAEIISRLDFWRSQS